MKKNRIVAALLCASMGFTAAAAFAQPVPGGRDAYHACIAHRAILAVPATAPR